MNKTEFLHALGGRLAQTLPREKVEEHVRYYDSYIMERINQGIREEEVIAQLGDPLLIAKTIMDTSEERRDGAEIYEEPDRAGEEWATEGWGKEPPHVHQFRLQTRGACLLAAVVFVLVTVLALWLVGSVVSFLLPVLIPVMIVVLIVSYMKQR